MLKKTAGDSDPAGSGSPGGTASLTSPPWTCSRQWGVDLTVFRKLRELDYCTSYSHRGRFYTLRELAEFDENGLWWIRSVGFSSRGTLVATAEGLVNASEAGYAVEELDAIVRVGTKDVLPKLAWEKRLRRTRIRNRNVYFSPKRSIREQQIASRRVWEAQPSVSKSIAAQDVLPDEAQSSHHPFL